MKRRPAAVLMVSAMMGAFFGDMASPTTCAILVGLSIGLALIPLVSMRIIAFIAFVFFLSAWSYSHYRITYDSKIAQLNYHTNFSGTIVDSVKRENGERHIYVTVSPIDDPATNFNIALHAHGACSAIDAKPGAAIYFSGTPHAFEQPPSRALFDARHFGISHDLHGSVTIENPHLIWIGEEISSNYFATLRAHIREQVMRSLTPKEASLLLALIIGDTSLFSEMDRSSFQDIGAQHLLAVSGMQISLIAWLCFFLLLPVIAWVMPSSRRHYAHALTALITVVVAYWFVGLAGFSASAVRALLMALFMLLPNIFARRIDAYDTFYAAGFLTVLWRPQAIYDLGFLLSYAAVFGLLVAHSSSITFIKSLARRSIVLGIFTRVLLASIAAFLATLPVIAITIRTIAPWSLMANFFLVPFAAITQIPAILLGLLGYFCDSAALTKFAGYFSNLIALLADGLAQIFGALIHVSASTSTVLVTFMIGCAAAFMLRRKFWLGVGIITVSLLWPLAPLAQDSRLYVTVIPVGQGDATLMSLPSGENILIDAGGSAFGSFDPGLRIVVPTLQYHGINTIDILVITHPDPDHLMGAFAILDNFYVKEIWHSGYRPEHPLTKRLTEVALTKNIPLKTTRAIYGSHYFGDTIVSILAPRDEDYYPELSANNNSLVLRITHGRNSMLWPGDLELWGEHLLLASGADVSANIVKAPHHGSKTSSSDPFIDAINPQHVVYSTGKKNRFGFPHQEVVERYRQRHVTEWNTAIDGEITISFDLKNFSINGHLSPFKEKT